MAVVTVRDLISKALLKLGVIRANGNVQADDAASGLASLQSQYNEWISQGTFGRVRSVNIATPQTVTAGLNQHISVTTDDTVVVELPATVSYDYWWTWQPERDYGWGKNVPVGADMTNQMPIDKSVILVTHQETAPGAALRATYVYDGTIQRWVRVDDLALDDEAPLSARGADGLAAILATRLAEEYGVELLSPLTVAAANRYKMALVARHGEDEYNSADW